MRPAPQLFSGRRRGAPDADVEDTPDTLKEIAGTSSKLPVAVASGNDGRTTSGGIDQSPAASSNGDGQVARTTTITFDPSTEQHKDNATLYIPAPQDRERGETFQPQYVMWLLTKEGYPIVAKTGDEEYGADDSDDGMT